MRRSLSLALLAASVLSAVALVDTPKAPEIVDAVVSRQEEGEPGAGARGDEAGHRTAGTEYLPSQLVRSRLDPARQDLFGREPRQESPAAAASAPTPAATTPQVASEPMRQQLPPVNLRFLGSLVAPGGEHIIYLARGDSGFAARVGDSLDEGYVIDSVSEDALTLFHASLDARVVIPIPAAPK